MPGDHHHHHHDHGGCHGEDGHDHSSDITPAIQSLLYTQIQFDSINTLNGMQRICLDLSFSEWLLTQEQKLLRNPGLPLFRNHGLKD